MSIIPGPGRDDRPFVWRLWWRFGFSPFCRILGWLPVDEWRRETWSWRVDIWAMNHIGRIGAKR